MARVVKYTPATVTIQELKQACLSGKLRKQGEVAFVTRGQLLVSPGPGEWLLPASEARDLDYYYCVAEVHVAGKVFLLHAPAMVSCTAGVELTRPLALLRSLRLPVNALVRSNW